MVDVLIIGAGASGAAVAWSLAETRMKILCLEQGDWIKPTEFPTNGRDWEARRYADFDISPNRRARDTDYPINDDNSLMKIANFNGVGGGTILFTAHYPRLHPSDFRVRTLDGIADDWPIDYWTLEPYFAKVAVDGVEPPDDLGARLVGGTVMRKLGKLAHETGADLDQFLAQATVSRARSTVEPFLVGFLPVALSVPWGHFVAPISGVVPCSCD
jgi:choline dehydrogenase-like flavoprotein